MSSEVKLGSEGYRSHVLLHMWIIELKQMVILLDMGHTKGRMCMGGIGQGKKTKNLKVLMCSLYRK